jgi:hypothetical protein
MPTPGRCVLSTLPCLLPFAIGGDGDANPAGAKLQDFRAVPGLDQSLTSPPRKAVNLAPLAQGHYALVVKRAVTFTYAVGLLFCFAKRHARTSSMGLAMPQNPPMRR